MLLLNKFWPQIDAKGTLIGELIIKISNCHNKAITVDTWKAYSNSGDTQHHLTENAYRAQESGASAAASLIYTMNEHYGSGRKGDSY